MATILTVRANLVDGTVAYTTTPADYITLDLAHDYLIWSEDLADRLPAEPSPADLNAHAVIIDNDAEKLVPECLVMDYSGDWGGAYSTYLVKGMGENKKYILCFSFDGATANEPQLEAWNDVTHTLTPAKHVLGYGTPANSMVKAICTTVNAPGANWALIGGAGIAIAGNDPARIVKLNGGLGALSVAGNCYANIAIVIPMAYATPAVESFVHTVRYTWN